MTGNCDQAFVKKGVMLLLNMIAEIMQSDCRFYTNIFFWGGEIGEEEKKGTGPALLLLLSDSESENVGVNG
jgi:hypothetical protein